MSVNEIQFKNIYVQQILIKSNIFEILLVINLNVKQHALKKMKTKLKIVKK